jgi:acyl carrier protein
MADSDNMRAKVKEDVIRIMAETLEISPDEITSDLSFNTDLPFDSLQLYEFVIDVEETYNIRLPDELLDQVKTVDDMIDVVMKLKK